MKQPLSIVIREEKISTAVNISRQIPEFVNPPAMEIYQLRLMGVPHLVLVAFVENELAGFKVGYEKADYFYSWMGGVLPKFRGLGIAKRLAEKQEKWAKNKGYSRIVFKTRNQHKGMLIFALKNNFNIIGFTEKESIETNRILLQKEL